MAIGSYLPLTAVTTVPFGRTVKLRQRGCVVDITGWSANVTLKDVVTGIQRLTLSTASPTSNGSSLSIVSAPLVDCIGAAILDPITELPVVQAALKWIISPADLAALPAQAFTGLASDPTIFDYSLIMTDTVPFTRRWLFGPFAVIQG